MSKSNKVSYLKTYQYFIREDDSSYHIIGSNKKRRKSLIKKRYKVMVIKSLSLEGIEDISKAPIIDKSVHYYTKPSLIDVPVIF